MATDILATVLADLEFCTANGTAVCMRAGEQVLVLEKTNDKWWKVSVCIYQICAFRYHISITIISCLCIQWVFAVIPPLLL